MELCLKTTRQATHVGRGSFIYQGTYMGCVREGANKTRCVAAESHIRFKLI
jgi:hypothetical protein